MPTLFFDCETTGLTKHPLVHERYQPEIIEFYGCLYDIVKKRKLAEFEALICPTRISEVPEKITKITGIDQALLEGKPTFEKVAGEVAKLIAKATGLCGHNVTFDVDCVNMEFARLGLPLPKWPSKGSWVCTVEQTMHLKGHRLSLEVLHEMLFGEVHKSAHRARADVEAHIRVVEEMIRRDML